MNESDGQLLGELLNKHRAILSQILVLRKTHKKKEPNMSKKNETETLAAITKVHVRITGITPLLMRRHPEEQEPAELRNSPPKAQAEFTVYRDGDTNHLFIPGPNLWRCIVAGAAYEKGPGRSSMVKSAAACFNVSPEHLDLGVEDYAVDSRWVVIKATGGRVMRHRPRLDNWAVSFDLTFDTAICKPEVARKIVDYAGSRVGVLDFRPACKGPYGRFMVTEWAL